MNNKNLPQVIKILKQEYKNFEKPSVTRISLEGNPFKVLTSCIISLRTKDNVTVKASLRLFKKAHNAKKLASLKISEIAKLIYPCAFYKTKAGRLKEISKLLIKDYKSKVPDELDELLKFKGVGRKTANLVLTLGYGKLGICVDTHVHRISNRLGYVKTKTPNETEQVLRKKLPKKYWIVYNDLLVSYGQNLCVPVSPWCTKCKLRKYCSRINVKTSR